MTEPELKNRTKQFALRVLKLVEALPKTTAGRVLGRQLARSGTSVGANYRAACRSKSRADFISKLGTTVEEADETLLWLELLDESGIVPAKQLESIKTETNELLRVLSTSLDTAKRGR